MNLASYQLTHPELLSEETLRELLKNRCIELPRLQLLSKPELVEIYKRVVLPLPQRQFDEARHLGKKLSTLRSKNGIATACYEENVFTEKEEFSPSKSNPEQNGVIQARVNNNVERLKPPISDSKSLPKKICLSHAYKAEKECALKRKHSEIKSFQGSLMDSKKRQKITWP
ncbi:uncharacterized protein LOC105697268 [Orussus abietinus]|uniref:uncharacterized protein LOC105697268 n=1 Tax=Orussus abietinus TaxID=222816 RepID=UPI000626CA96|nr:uncharacterized protein LOC105697268 [Orussus abietinus]